MYSYWNLCTFLKNWSFPRHKIYCLRSQRDREIVAAGAVFKWQPSFAHKAQCLWWLVIWSHYNSQSENNLVAAFSPKWLASTVSTNQPPSTSTTTITITTSTFHLELSTVEHYWASSACASTRLVNSERATFFSVWSPDIYTQFSIYSGPNHPLEIYFQLALFHFSFAFSKQLHKKLWS